jgi:hypothetical protein
MGLSAHEVVTDSSGKASVQVTGNGRHEERHGRGAVWLGTSGSDVHRNRALVTAEPALQSPVRGTTTARLRFASNRDFCVFPPRPRFAGGCRIVCSHNFKEHVCLLS